MKRRPVRPAESSEEPVREPERLWWEDDDAEIQAIKVRQRARLAELHPEWSDSVLDDPRSSLGLEPSFRPERDDALLMALHRELLAARVRQYERDRRKVLRDA